MGRGSSYVVAAALLAVAPPVHAAPDPEPVATDLLSPLSQAVADDGTIWFSQNYAGLLQRLTPGGQPETVVDAPGDLEIAAVAEDAGTVTYAVTGAGHTIGRLRERAPDGTDTVLADLYAHEQEANPDGAFRYGFRGLPRACRTELGDNERAAYRGKVETHPVAALPAYGAVYVADAAANAVVAVSGPDVVATVTTFPAVRTTVTAAYAEENGFPDCTVGRDYWAEAVPTDVVPGPYGSLYVTTFPGGPGRVDGEPAGMLWRVLALTGQAIPVVTALDSPVGVAVGDDGEVYVSELEAGRISRVEPGSSRATPFASIKYPGDLQWTPDGLLAGVDVLSGTNGVDPPEGELAFVN